MKNKKRTSLEMRLARLLLAMPTPGEREVVKEYTDWCTGADGTNKQPYPQRRHRQCSIGYHFECSDPAGEVCGCPCHRIPADMVERCAP